MMKRVEVMVTVQVQVLHEADVGVGVGHLFLPSSMMPEREQEVHPHDEVDQFDLFFLLTMMAVLVETVDDP